jgi:hypothetical protein
MADIQGPAGAPKPVDRRPGATGAAKPAAGGPPAPGQAPSAPAARDEARLDAPLPAGPTGAKKPLAPYTPGPGEADEGGEVFTSRGLVPPAEPGVRVAARAAEGDYEVRVAWARGAGGLVPAGVDVRANAAGDVVTVQASGEVAIGGAPVALVPERPHALPGGGAVTDWGAGYVTIDSAAGDAVSVFARGERLDLMGRLAGDRLPGALAPAP